MLLAFRVANFRAFQHPQELTLRHTKGLRVSRPTEGIWDSAISTVAAIYGANASGKSTLFRSFAYFREAVQNSYRRWDIDDSTGVVPFVLDPSTSDQPSEFEIEFRAEDGVEYQYGFAIDRERVHSEWLYMYRTASRSILFERGLGTDRAIRFGNSFRGNKQALQDATATRQNALTLSVGAQLGNDLLQPVYRWITRNLRTYNARHYEHGHREVVRRISDDESFAAQLADVLAKADLGVSGIEVYEEPMDEEVFKKTIDVAKLIGDDIDESEIRRFAEERSKSLQLSHSNGDVHTRFPFGWESDGTQALISFAAVAIMALKSGSVMVIDEIDTSLHPLLVAELVALFTNVRTNPHQAQMIFTTHDVSLLSKNRGNHELLGRDQIWITEKSVDGASSLVALSEYRTPRKEENLERGYLTGRYGGIPVISLFDAFDAVPEGASENLSHAAQ